MSAQFLLGLFDSAYVVALTAWAGSILFFSFAVTPMIFKVLGPESAGKFVRAFFPVYYTWGAICGAVALPACVAVPLCYPEYRGPTVAIQAMLILGGTLIMLYAGNSLTPAINAARDAGESGRVRLQGLHRQADWLNVLVLLIGIGLLIALVNRPVPRTSGLRQLSPGEQARFDAGLNEVIEQVEVKYGFRTGGDARTGQPPAAASDLDPEMVREIESYYEQKKARDLARGRGTGPARLQNTEPAQPGAVTTPPGQSGTQPDH